jgi:hypothetical protein
MLLLSGKDKPIRFTQEEIENLRKYLIERGGFLFINDAADTAGVVYRSIIRTLERALPEYSMELIPNDHETYNCFYKMNGPPAMGPLSGIFVNNRLAVLISNTGFWDTLTGEGPYSPGVMRFCTNVVIYAVTHGQISDDSAYRP